MPELPEVEITRRGIAPMITNQRISGVVVRNPNLRWQVPQTLSDQSPGQVVTAVNRRAKYLLLETAAGTIIIHLGMSGSLRVLSCAVPPKKHDHIDINFDRDICLRYRDPRRFGCVLWVRHPLRHRLLRDLGPEPLAEEFDGTHLYAASRRRPGFVKNLLMNASVVSGIGNIYANEALFAAGIHPKRRANRISLSRYQRLSLEIRRVLQEAISAGGTTLRDFQNADGHPGYFSVSLKVYGRQGEPCVSCGRPLRQVLIQQRASVYCAQCQT